LRLPHARSGVAPYVTISGGVAVLGEQVSKAEQLIEAADRKLYQAKHLGRNLMVSVEHPEVV
jgi:PleD family two-component response regulator